MLLLYSPLPICYIPRSIYIVVYCIRRTLYDVHCTQCNVYNVNCVLSIESKLYDGEVCQYGVIMLGWHTSKWVDLRDDSTVVYAREAMRFRCA